MNRLTRDLSVSLMENNSQIKWHKTRSWLVNCKNRFSAADPGLGLEKFLKFRICIFLYYIAFRLIVWLVNFSQGNPQQNAGQYGGRMFKSRQEFFSLFASCMKMRKSQWKYTQKIFRCKIDEKEGNKNCWRDLSIIPPILHFAANPHCENSTNQQINWETIW